ncbi:DUF6049 family protein, partial [Rhizobium johnstonii]|uniref:DUF6049 family protein n=1 Tax=Rhizobium johnstonii TaxID=3019933 RepID=UPI003F9AADDB
SEGTTRVSTTRRLAASEQSLASFATAAVDPTVITGPERNSILGLLAIGWIDQADTWAGAVAAHETQTTATLNSITIVHSSDLLVLGSPAQIPVSVKNTLDTPVTVQVTAVPSNGRLIVDHSDPITVEAGSSSKVLIPVS